MTTMTMMPAAVPARRRARLCLPPATSPASQTPARSAGALAGATLSFGPVSIAHHLSLFAVWLTIAISGVVFAEPAPVDVFSCGLLLLLPTVGLVTITRSLLAFLFVWLVVAALGFVAAAMAPDVKSAVIFTAVSLYLYLAAFMFAAFVARRPIAHTRLILNAWTVAAIVASLAGLIGYFSLLPGAEDWFTKYGRASGTFKDPNVFGPFLVVPALYMLHLVIDRPLKKAALPLGVAGFLALSVLLTFSRGAWVNLAISVVIFGYLSFALSKSPVHRARIVLLLVTGCILMATVLIIAVQNDRVADLLAQRATLTQSYDVGPHGRFGGQAKAIDLILENPFGIGALVFGTKYHHEAAHNVYLTMLMNTGWLGGLLFALIHIATIGLATHHLLKARPTRPLFMIVFSAFLALVLEGFLIDIDHWRHLYLLMGLLWGLMAVEWHGLPYDRPRRAERG